MVHIEVDRTKLYPIQWIINRVMNFPRKRVMVFLAQELYNEYYNYILSKIPIWFMDAKLQKMIVLKNGSEIIFLIKKTPEQLRMFLTGWSTNDIVVLDYGSNYEIDYYLSLYLLTVEDPIHKHLYYYCYQVPLYLVDCWYRQLDEGRDGQCTFI